MPRLITVSAIMNKKHQTLEFTGEWLEAFGKPETNGVWFIWGNSGNGKTIFTLKLCKELAKFGKVAYNSLEEGDSLTMKNAIVTANMIEVEDKFVLLKENIQELTERLDKRKSPQFIVIDSIQYTMLNIIEYRKLVERFPNKLLIFVSQADGKQPLGRTAKSVHYDAALKIWVEGFKAYSKGRYIGANGGTYIIWNEGAQKMG